ncbi:hypothetical protein [Corynebacterium matruchotii]|uniref:hypothetical protein n=1 Tax=Corynebacterium matruchotii TaxID=43768 RepID=UPI00366F358D
MISIPTIPPPPKIVGFFPGHTSISKCVKKIWAIDTSEFVFYGGEHYTIKFVLDPVDGINKPRLGVYHTRCSNKLADPVGERTVVTGKFPPRLGIHQELVIEFQRHVDRPNSKETVLPLTISLHYAPQ